MQGNSFEQRDSPFELPDIRESSDFLLSWVLFFYAMVNRSMLIFSSKDLQEYADVIEEGDIYLRPDKFATRYFQQHLR